MTNCIFKLSLSVIAGYVILDEEEQEPLCFTGWEETLKFGTLEMCLYKNSSVITGGMFTCVVVVFVGLLQPLDCWLLL